jgi:hypothetical protein
MVTSTKTEYSTKLCKDFRNSNLSGFKEFRIPDKKIQNTYVKRKPIRLDKRGLTVFRLLYCLVTKTQLIADKIQNYKKMVF